MKDRKMLKVNKSEVHTAIGTIETDIAAFANYSS